MFVYTHFKITCSFANVNLITSTRASVYYVGWMSVFVFEFKKCFDLACLPHNIDVKFPFGVFVKFCYEFPALKFIFLFQSEPAKHLKKHPEHKFTWDILN